MAGPGLCLPGDCALKPRDISITGLELAALTNGGNGPRVLALHGWLDNASSFAPLAPFLEELDLVCLDFPGHGHSDHRPEGCRYHFDDYAFDVLAAADALGWERFHLLGHSLGGAAGTLAMAMAPARIASAVLIEGLGPLSSPPNQAATAARDSHEKTRLRARRYHSDVTGAARARANNSDLDIQAATLLADRGTRIVPGKGVAWRHDLRLTWPSVNRFTEPQVLDLLAGIECPVLNIISDPPGGIFPRSRLERRLATLRSQTLKTIPGGHHLHMTNPGPVAHWILEHINGND